MEFTLRPLGFMGILQNNDHILLSTERLFLCITTLQCGYKVGCFQVRIATRLTLPLAENLPLSRFWDLRQLRNLTHLVSTFVSLNFTPLDNGVLN